MIATILIDSFILALIVVVIGLFAFMYETFNGILPFGLYTINNKIIDLRGWGEKRRYVKNGEFNETFCNKCGKRLIVIRQIHTVQYNPDTGKRKVEYKYDLLCGVGYPHYSRKDIRKVTFD